MAPRPFFDCCGRLWTHVGDDARAHSTVVCRDCPRRYFLTLPRFTKPEGIEPDEVLHIDGLIKVVTDGAGR